MYLSHSIAVVIPTYNEEQFVAKTISHVPNFVDWIIVVNDASSDDSLQAIANAQTTKVQIVNHQNNLGVGAATISGYRSALALGANIIVVMDGDGQMDSKDLPNLLNTLILNNYDYVKGNRFLDKSISSMPRCRYLGNIIFSFLMQYSLKIPFNIDSQCGYAAITSQAVKEIDLDKLYPRYGFLNSLLFSLAEKNMRIAVAPVRTIYGKEKSDINPFITIPTILYIILSCYLKSIFIGLLAKVSLEKAPLTNKPHSLSITCKE
ncbi:MAG: glycosyltransferase family 2 protein [Acidobacteria bacterium]|nr:glycosyltransferase family 2 protein [Acidobacteriota bacterium]